MRTFSSLLFVLLAACKARTPGQGSTPTTIEHFARMRGLQFEVGVTDSGSGGAVTTPDGRVVSVTGNSATTVDPATPENVTRTDLPAGGVGTAVAVGGPARSASGADVLIAGFDGTYLPFVGAMQADGAWGWAWVPPLPLDDLTVRGDGTVIGLGGVGPIRAWELGPTGSLGEIDLDVGGHADATVVAPTGDGGILVGGSIDLGYPVYDGIVASIDADGTSRWQTRFAVGAFFEVRALAELPDGRVAVAGTASGDGFLALLDPDGGPEWHVSFPASANHLAVSGDRIVVEGGKDGEIAALVFDAGDGSVQHAATFGDGSDAIWEIPSGITFLPDGRLVIASMDFDGNQWLVPAAMDLTVSDCEGSTQGVPLSIVPEPSDVQIEAAYFPVTHGPAEPMEPSPMGDATPTMVATTDLCGG